jgi:hypothetical protein
MTNNKLPEVGEFWDTGGGFRTKVIFREGARCLVREKGGDWKIYSATYIAMGFTYLPWCKSFDDSEPKPQTEEVEFNEYICGQELKWLSWVPADAIPTGLVRKVKVSK